MKMILLVLTFLSIPAFGEDKNDPGGWNKAKWGMTVKQVITAFEGSKYKLIPIRDVDGPKMDALLAIDGCVDLGLQNPTEPTKCFYVWFGFTKTAPAMLVHVDMKPDLPYPNWTIAAFSQLREMLTDKYGLPTSESKTTDSHFDHEFIWKFPASKIRLSLFELTGTAGRNPCVSLQYMKLLLNDKL